MKKVHYIIAPLVVTLVITFGFAFRVPTNCPPEGATKNGGIPTERRQETNREKNRRTQPAAGDINYSITLEKMLNSGDDPTKFNHTNAAVIEGYIFKAKDEGKESCNCYSENPADHDVHVYISQNPHPQGIGECAVIEVTPYSRHLNPQWTSEYINENFAGRKVKVTGWMLHDWEHTSVSYETNPNATRVERRTVWEIHPITHIQLDAQ